MKKIYILLGVIIVVAVVIFAGIFVYQNFLAHKSQSQQQPVTNNQKQTANQIFFSETFTDKYGFYMQYPSDKTVMNVPTSKMVACNNSCPTELVVNGITSTYANQKINGVDYCIYSGPKNINGNVYNDYLFLTVKNNNCYGLEISYSNISHKSSNDTLVFQAISTLKFTK